MIAASIVIPAHNEQSTIMRLLDALTTDTATGEFEVLVVCNGCTDRTADVARGYGPAVRVVELERPSKREAMLRGDQEATAFPRVYVDADVVIDAAGVRSLLGVLGGPVLAAAPTRILARDRVGHLVRAYYDVWEQLPQVRAALVGRGVVAVSRAGHERIGTLPPVMSDDLAIAAAFGDDERLIVHDAHVVIWPPRTLRDLLRRRIRVNTGNAQLNPTPGLKTSPRTLVRMARAQPGLILKLPVCLGVAIASRTAAQRRISRGDFDTWLRDESSRQRTS